MRGILVTLVLSYLRFWAKVTLRVNRPYIIGVAGSAGKSSARNALFSTISEYYSTKVVTGNSETGVPIGILGLTLDGFKSSDWLNLLWKAPSRILNLRRTKYLIVEMGIDDPHPPKNMEYLLTIVKPDLAISLNVAGPHLQQFEKLLPTKGNYHKNPERRMDFILTKMAEEDTKIITNSNCKIGVYNNDNEYVKKAVEAKINPKTKLMRFGKDKTNDISYKDYDISPKRTKFLYVINGREFELVFRKFVLPPAYHETFAAVILASLSIGLSLTQIKVALEANFTLPKSRASVFEGYKNSTLIDSTYNAPKLAVLSFLDMLVNLKKKTGRPTIAVIGDMRELGNQAEHEHKEVAEKLIKSVDYVYCVGPLTQEYVYPIVREALKKRGTKVKRVQWYKNAVQLGLHLKEEMPDDAIILFKGSQNTIFLEEAVKFVLANPQDAKNLTRQEEYWTGVKQEFFSVSE